MIALVRAESRRLAARRVVKGLALLVLAVSAVAGVLVFVNHGSVPESVLSARRAESERLVAACIDGEIDPTTLPPEVGFVPPPGQLGPARQFPPGFCREAFGRVSDERFLYSDMPGILKGTTAPLVILAMVLGASAMGADWQSRSLTTLLTWEPRRGRVVVAKALGVALVVAAFTLVAQAVISAALLPSGLFRGSMAGVGGEWLRSVAATLARGSLVTVVFALLGFSGASMAKSTTAVLGISFGYITVIENVVGSFLASWRQWLLLGNTIVWVAGQDENSEVLDRTVTEAGLYLAALGVGAVLVAVLVLRNRDVA